MKKPGRRNLTRSILIFGYIIAVLIFSGLARADVKTLSARLDRPAFSQTGIER